MNRWNDSEAEGLDDFGLLLYTSHLLGADPSLVVWGGGNTSLKRSERDFRGLEVETLWIKASGCDLKTIGREGFVALRLEDLRLLLDREQMSDEAMLEHLGHSLLRPDAPRPSVETLLHAFLPYRFVHHTHPDGILALTNLADSDAVLGAALGDNVISVPYVHPGFQLARLVVDAYGQKPAARGVVLEKHGLVTFGETARESYESTIALVERATRYLGRRRRALTLAPSTALRAGLSRREREGTPPSPRQRPPARSPSAGSLARLLCAIRGAVSRERRMVLCFDGERRVRELLASPELLRRTQAGPATPDHLIRTKPWPLVLAWQEFGDGAGFAQHLREQMDSYVQKYGDYFRRHAPSGLAMHDPFPRVVLLPGLGLAAAGRDYREALVARAAYRRTLDVIDHSLVLGEYRPAGEDAMFEMEHWEAQLYKLTLGAPSGEQPRSLAGQVALVTGAASGIGRAVAQRLAAEGAHVVVADLDAAGARQVAGEIGGASASNPALAVGMDVTQEGSVREGIEGALVRYGGLDIVVSNAGIARSAPIRELPLGDWERSFAVNARGHFLVAREALGAMHTQGLGGSFVFVASKNVFGPGAEFGAYSAAKAAEVQLAKVLALEEGRHGIRVNIVSPDAVFTGSRLWSDEMKRDRAAAHGIPPEELESFYAARNLLGVRILPEDVAEAVLFLASARAAKITGCTITVDGGVREAFPR